MNSIERVEKTLRREAVDRIPIFEWIIDPHVIEQIMPGGTEEDFIDKYEFDAVCVDLDYNLEKIEENIFKDEWGQVKQYGKEGHSMPLYGPFVEPEDMKGYIPPDPTLPHRYRSLEAKLNKYGNDKAVILHLNDVFSIPSRLMTYEDFMVNIALEPQFIADVIHMTVDVNLAMAAEAVKRGCKFIYTGDDLAYGGGPFIDPETFRKIFYPEFCRVMKGYKDLGLYVIKHTDGNIMPIIDMLVDSGIDCLDPIDPGSNMSLEYVKKTYGDRIAIKGNVDCAQTLTFGTVEETEAEAKKCIEIAKPGYGYIFSSSNSIHSGVKPENFLAMIDIHKKYAKY